MGEEFPKSVREVVSTLAELFRLQGNSSLGDLLENAHSSLGEVYYDNLNGGTYTWALLLEVELGLKSMHALAALITPDFYDSAWTEQEVGWALGRGVLALPVRVGGNPRGFASKVQAVTGELNMFPAPLAKAMVTALLSHPQTRPEMKRALVPAFAKSTCWADAKKMRDLILSVPLEEYTQDEKSLIRNSVRDNNQVGDAIGVPGPIQSRFGKPDPAPEEIAEDAPF